MATTVAAEIKGFDPEEYMTKKMARRVDPFIAYQIVAAKKALHSAKLPFAKGEELDATLDVTRTRGFPLDQLWPRAGCHSFSTATKPGQEYPPAGLSGTRKMNPLHSRGSFITKTLRLHRDGPRKRFMGPKYSISSVCAAGTASSQRDRLINRRQI